MLKLFFSHLLLQGCTEIHLTLHLFITCPHPGAVHWKGLSSLILKGIPGMLV